ncbi:MAG: sodium:proton antiporter [Nitrospinae bacterium]|nr:sodium:proton antiporter [Nitrospinota bacterium]
MTRALIILSCLACLLVPPGALAAPAGGASGEGERHGQALTALSSSAHEGEHTAPQRAEHGEVARHKPDVVVPIWSVAPFVGLLLCIAFIPLISGTWWHHHFPKVSLAFFAPMVVYDLLLYAPALATTTIEYISFIALVGSLYVISGGIYIRGSIQGKPLTNTVIMAIGSLLASFIGTTGAALTLIRPLLRANERRDKKVHTIIFFTFLVANIGGSLTPLGDPPLFLGFLQGVDFFWTFRLTPHWAFAVLILLAIYFVWDTVVYRREEPQPEPDGVKEPFGIEGKINFLFLLGVLCFVLLYKNVRQAFPHFHYAGDIFQVGGMFAMAAISLWITPKRIREENGFTWFPVKEVAILFAAIFAAMMPTLLLLQTRGAELGVTKPWQFFWVTGILSSFLDNAPTYLTFLSLAKALPAGSDFVPLLDGSAVNASILKGISVGAVFMGANSYIGNAPNFMVKSVSEEAGVKMPSFFGYMAYSTVILIPLFFVVTWIFF